MTEKEKTIIIEIHDRTCYEGKEFYRDPFTRNLVFTKTKHLRRGYCCKNRCRHCPYGFNQDAL
ncbi:MAG: hypothetical protein FJ219_04835 [Ignavibacteria bacterium]|nr:hypothetical protein [Ignavibacteria bacterium]